MNLMDPGGDTVITVPEEPVQPIIKKSFNNNQDSPLEVQCFERDLKRASIKKGYDAACEEGPGLFSHLLTLCSMLLIIATLPASLFFVVKVVQEYERAVIFRLGRLLSGGARGPGVFFIIPCLDIYQKIDMRTATYDVPPQEVRIFPGILVT